MNGDRLVTGLAAVFSGLTATLLILSITEQPFLLFAALPFALTTYFLWYHASGRLAARARRRARAGGPRRSAPGGGGFGAGPRARADARRAGAGGSRGRGARRAHRERRERRGRRDRHAPRSTDGPSRREAYRVLGLDPGAGTEAVERAYRAKVKQVHPDAESGDAESFKRVNRAYERLTAD